MDRRWKVLAVTSVSVFMGFLDATIVNIAFPAIARDFSGHVWCLGSVVGAQCVQLSFSRALLVTAGRLADRYRPSPGLPHRDGCLRGRIGGVCGGAHGRDADCGPGIPGGRAPRCSFRFGLALLLPEFPPSAAGLAVGLYGAAGGVAAATGPALGGATHRSPDWRWVFLGQRSDRPDVTGRRRVGPARSRDAERGAGARPRGGRVITVQWATLALGIVQGQAWGWAMSDGSSPPSRIAVLTGVAFVLTLGAAIPSLWSTCRCSACSSFALANTGMVLWVGGVLRDAALQRGCS